jgi:hypothetical protein
MLKDAKAENIVFIAFPKQNSWMLNEGTLDMFQSTLEKDTIKSDMINEQQFIYGGDIDASELKKLVKYGKKSRTKSYFFEFDKYGITAYFINESTKTHAYRHKLKLKGAVHLPPSEIVHIIRKDDFESVLNLRKNVSLKFGGYVGAPAYLGKKELNTDGNVLMSIEKLLRAEVVL